MCQLRNQFIQLGKQLRIVLTRIGCQRLRVPGQVEEKRFHPLLIQFFPPHAVAGLIQIIGIENLLKLVLYRNGQIRLTQVERLTDQREARVGDNRLAARQVFEKAFHAGLLKQNAALLAFFAKPVGDEVGVYLFQQFGQIGRGRSDIDQDVIAVYRLRVQHFAAQNWRNKKRIAAADTSREKRRDQVGIRSRRHQAREQLGCGRIAPRSLGYRDLRVGQAVLIVDRDNGQAASASGVARERLKIRDYKLGLPLVHSFRELCQAAGGAGSGNQVFGERLPVADAVVHVRQVKPENLRYVEVAAQVLQPAIKRGNTHGMPFLLKVRDDFFRSRRVARSFAIHAIQNIG